ncbi:MAG: ATP-binding cassette domain-containing protein [Anaerolineae bacterium]|nr:ATP-binding cassette domain-containing protein [Anaerolineae bacterium]
MGFLAHEVVQTSAMDCGPASLKSLMEGFGISVSYDRLREACQTDIDGTSIDTLEEIANQIGLDAEQVMLPLDHVLLDEAHALPAIAVIRLPNANIHFTVLWRQHGPFVQVMDPAIGRRWIKSDTFLNDLYIHTFPVPTSDWREWAETAEFIKPLENRMLKLGVTSEIRGMLIASARSDLDWFSLAALDATVRMMTHLLRSGGLKRGRHAQRLIQELYTRIVHKRESASILPAEYWFVQPAPLNAEGEPQLFLRGALLMRVRGRKSHAANASEQESPEPILSPDLIAALRESPRKPARELLNLLIANGTSSPLSAAILAVLAGAVVVIQALTFWLLINAKIRQQVTGISLENAGLIALAFGLTCLALLLNWQTTNALLKLGQGIEVQLRRLFMYRIPLLGDRYFRSRLRSDMAARSHLMYQVHYFPETLGRILFMSCESLFTAIAMVWASPGHIVPIFLAAASALGVPFLTFPVLSEQDMRVRTHLGALSHSYLDAMLGLVPLRAHSAERALRREHETILRVWRAAFTRLLDLKMLLVGVQVLMILGSLVWLILQMLSRGAATPLVLLLVFWGLHLAFLGREIMQHFQNYLTQRNLTQRLIEPIAAVEAESISETKSAQSQDGSIKHPAETPSVAIHMDSVLVRAGGHTILQNISFNIQPGSHVAIMGPSGAGKSSLVGLLLGWHAPSDGEFCVDGAPLEGAALEELRRTTVWVDPGVQIWNRSLIENLCYGTNRNDEWAYEQVIEEAELQDVIAKLPQGIHTQLGESGGLVSGGEGQRVRLARGMLNPKARLVILDEPFRGLDRNQRQVLITRARALWQHATLLCITHDVQETRSFDRVLIMEHGQIVEDGLPEVLAANPESYYSRILEAEQALHRELWGGQFWRSWLMQNGQVESVSERQPT